MGTKKYLDLDGLGAYHDELAERLKNLEYDPSRMFDDKEDLFSTSKWETDSLGRLYGLKEGLIVTVGGQFWQLEDPEKWSTIYRRVQPIEEKLENTPEQLGWRIVGNTVDFNIDDHVLQLTK